MNDICTYTVKIHGQVTEGELNVMSPIRMTVSQSGAAETLLTVSADQSGLLGLVSYLHGRGLVFLAITRTEQTAGA